MILLTPRPCPTELTPEVQAALTAEFLADKTKSPWKKAYIERELLALTSNKCCYRECYVHEESKYMEVEHFFAKHWHERRVLEWINLLPACKRCNIAKLDHDCAIEPIIHPAQDDPRLHLKWRAYRFYDKTLLGDKTIEVLDLNDWERLVMPRFEVGKNIHEQLEKLKDLATIFHKAIKPITGQKNRIARWMKMILNEAQPKKEYAATAATVLLNEPLYFKVKSILQSCGIWDVEMTEFEVAAQAIALDIF